MKTFPQIPVEIFFPLGQTTNVLPMGMDQDTNEALALFFSLDPKSMDGLHKLHAIQNDPIFKGGKRIVFRNDKELIITIIAPQCHDDDDYQKVEAAVSEDVRELQEFIPVKLAEYDPGRGLVAYFSFLQ